MATIAAPLYVLALTLSTAASERWRPPELKVKPPPPLVTFEQVRDLAFRYLGRPYHMGGVGSPAFDCSGFICRVFAEAGYALPRVSREQVSAGRHVDPAHMEPGDLMFFTEEPGDLEVGHVAMYLGNNELIHANHTGGSVTLSHSNAKWFRDRLVAVRRVLPATAVVGGHVVVTSTVPNPPVIAAHELVEHTGDRVLLPMLRLPAEHAPPSTGPELATTKDTSLALRSAMVTDRGSFGLTLVPEASIFVHSIAFAAQVAVPVRFEVDSKPTVGDMNRAADATRFIRTVSLGLPGADVEARISRLGDLTLLDGFLINKLAPGAAASQEVSGTVGVPGLSVVRSRLSFFGAVRSDLGTAQALLDDVVDPKLIGGAVSAQVIEHVLQAGAAGATEQAGALEHDPMSDADIKPRAVNVAQAFLRVDPYEDEHWTFSANLDAGGAHALSTYGYGLDARVSLEYRLPSSGTVLKGNLHGGYLGANFLDSFFDATYFVSRPLHLQALASVLERGVLGGEVTLLTDRFSAGASWAEGVGANRHPFDRQVGLLADVHTIHVGGNRLLDLRIAYLGRAPFKTLGISVIHGGARLRMFSWLFGEVYFEKGSSFEGGGGVTLTFVP